VSRGHRSVLVVFSSDIFRGAKKVCESHPCPSHCCYLEGANRDVPSLSVDASSRACPGVASSEIDIGQPCNLFYENIFVYIQYVFFVFFNIVSVVKLLFLSKVKKQNRLLFLHKSFYIRYYYDSTKTLLCCSRSTEKEYGVNFVPQSQKRNSIDH
jgi:hypothetical protein